MRTTDGVRGLLKKVQMQDGAACYHQKGGPHQKGGR